MKDGDFRLQISETTALLAYQGIESELRVLQGAPGGYPFYQTPQDLILTEIVQVAQDLVRREQRGEIGPLLCAGKGASSLRASA